MTGKLDGGPKKKVASMRASRRVDVKYPAAGPGKKLRKKWVTDREQTRGAMVEAGERLLASQCCPTLPNVAAEMAKAGVKRSEATINRNSDALDEVRKEWEARHGKVPQWHRAADQSEEDAIVELGQCDCDDDEVGLVRKQLARARRELAQARETIDGLRADNALLSEQVRRLELGPRGEC